MDFEHKPLIKAINTVTTLPLNVGDVAIQNVPVPVNQNNRNTRATLIASAASPFQGSITVYYNRFNIGSLQNVDLKVPMSATDLDVKLALITSWYAYNYTILPDDLEITSKTANGYRKWNYVFKAHNYSVSFIGQKTIPVKFNYSPMEILSKPRIDIENWTTIIAVPV